MPIDSTTYARWWPLHLQVARGETLAAEDRAFYDHVRLELEREEVIGGVNSVRQVRAAVTALEAERTRLENRRQQLDEEIVRLEARCGWPCPDTKGERTMD
jgi:hypothetical protein